MKSSLKSCQSKNKVAKRTEPTWFVFVRDGSHPRHMHGLYLETMKTGEELTWIHLSTPSHFPDLFLTELESSALMWLRDHGGELHLLMTTVFLRFYVSLEDISRLYKSLSRCRHPKLRDSPELHPSHHAL